MKNLYLLKIINQKQMHNIKNTINKPDYKMNIIIFILLTVSVLKATFSFSDGPIRKYSYLIDFFTKINTELILLLFTIIFILTMKNIYYTKSIPKINLTTILFLVFKFWLLLVWFYYEVIKIDIILSLFLLVLITYYIAQQCNKNKDTFHNIIITFGIFIIFYNLINYYEILFNSANVFWKGRLYGVSNHPNFIGGYLAISLPFLIYLTFITKSNIKLIYALFIFSTFILILLSGSRGSIVVAIISIFTWFYLFNNKKFFFYSILLLSIFFILVNLDIFSNFNLLNKFEEFNSSRLFLTQNTRNEVFNDLYNIFYNNYIIGNPVIVAHTSSSYLATMARGGLIGLIILMILVIVLMSKIYLSKNNKNLIHITFSSSIIAFLFYSFFEGVMIENFSYGLLIFLFGIIYMGQKDKNEL